MESFSPGCSGLGSPDRGRQYVVTTRTPPLGSRECRSGPASASNASIGASPGRHARPGTPPTRCDPLPGSRSLESACLVLPRDRASLFGTQALRWLQPHRPRCHVLLQVPLLQATDSSLTRTVPLLHSRREGLAAYSLV